MLQCAAVLNRIIGSQDLSEEVVLALVQSGLLASLRSIQHTNHEMTSEAVRMVL